MIDHFAVGIQTARASARIHALLVHARPCQRAIGGAQALGLTIRRLAKVARQARANRLRIDVSTLAIRAARRRITGIRHWIFYPK